MKLKFDKIFLIIGIMFLFILSSINLIVAGPYKKERFEMEIINEDLGVLFFDLKFDYADDSGSNAKYEYYKEELLKCSGAPEEQYSEIVDIKGVVEPLYNSVLSFGPMNSSWPMKSHDTRHTGLSPYSTADVDGLEKWRFNGDWVVAGIAIDEENNIYFGDAGGYFNVVFPNGSLKWNYKTGGYIISTPAIAEDGTIYIGTYDCGLYAFNPDGSLKWRFPSGGSISSSPAISADGTIYFGTLGPHSLGRIYAVNPDGTEKWFYLTEFYIESDPVIAEDGTIFIGSMDGYLYAMNPNGTLKWRFKTGDEIHGHASIAEDGTIYISSFDDNLYAINPDGTEKWHYDTTWGASGGIAIGDDGTIYVGTDNMYAIWPNGTTRWIFNLDGYYVGESSPAISADGTIYVGISAGVPGYSEGGVILAINPDGTEQWRKRIDSHGWMDSSPSIGEDGTVYIGSKCEGQRGYLHAFGPVESNDPPGKPIITGEVNGHPREEYCYFITSIDPDNNPVHFIIDWGDGNEEETPERASGEDAWFFHYWNRRGTYLIKAKAIDVLGEESDWGYLEVTMPYNNQIPSFGFPLLQKILYKFPNAFPIL